MYENMGVRNKPIGVEIGRRLVITFLRRALTLFRINLWSFEVEELVVNQPIFQQLLYPFIINGRWSGREAGSGQWRWRWSLMDQMVNSCCDVSTTPIACIPLHTCTESCNYRTLFLGKQYRYGGIGSSRHLAWIPHKLGWCSACLEDPSLSLWGPCHCYITEV